MTKKMLCAIDLAHCTSGIEVGCIYQCADVKPFVDGEHKGSHDTAIKANTKKTCSFGKLAELVVIKS